MNRAEDRLNGSIDRNRDKAANTARHLQVRELARSTVNCAVMEMPEEDRAEFMRASIHHLRTLYGAGEGEAEAAALFGKLADAPMATVSRAIVRARAEQVFAANDDRGGPVIAGTALASALRKLNEPARSTLAPIADELEGRK